MAKALFPHNLISCSVFADRESKLIGHLLAKIKIVDELPKRHAPELHDDEFYLERVFNLPQCDENKELQRQYKDPHREDELLGDEYESYLDYSEHDTNFSRCLDLTDNFFELFFS